MTVFYWITGTKGIIQTVQLPWFNWNSLVEAVFVKRNGGCLIWPAQKRLCFIIVEGYRMCFIGSAQRMLCWIGEEKQRLSLIGSAQRKRHTIGSEEQRLCLSEGDTTASL